MIAVLIVGAVIVAWLSAGLSERSKVNMRRAELDSARRERDDERWRRAEAREQAALDNWLRSQP